MCYSTYLFTKSTNCAFISIICLLWLLLWLFITFIKYPQGTCLFNFLVVTISLSQVLHGNRIDSKSAYIALFIFNDLAPGTYCLMFLPSSGSFTLQKYCIYTVQCVFLIMIVCKKNVSNHNNNNHHDFSMIYLPLT